MDENYIVTKSNNLIVAKYNLTTEEQRIILTLASMVQPNDEEFKTYKFKIKDFIKLLEIKDDKKYILVPNLVKGLLKKPFTIKEGTKKISLNWISSTIEEESEESEKGVIEIAFDPRLKPYLLQLKEYYTSYKLKNILKLQSKYSIRIYEILKSHQYKNEFMISINQFKDILDLEGYSTYGNINLRILKSTQKELRDKTDIFFDYDGIKTGRKVTDIKFTIHSNKDLIEGEKNKKIIPIKKDKKSKVKEKGIEDYDSTLIGQIKDIFIEPVTNKDCIKILNLARNDISLVKEKYNLAKSNKRIRNVVGWIINAIKEDYKEQSKISISTFNNFKQRNYNYENLKKKLLGYAVDDEDLPLLKD